MPKTKFRAPVEHSLLLVAFILVWLGPTLKLIGVFTCSWAQAFLVHEVLFVIAVLTLLADVLVGLEPEQAHAHQL